MLENMVDETGIEPTTSSLRTRRKRATGKID
jgi:hypothetical protein